METTTLTTEFEANQSKIAARFFRSMAKGMAKLGLILLFIATGAVAIDAIVNYLY